MLVVLTGDIVDSAALSPADLDRTIESLRDAGTAMADWPHESDRQLSGFARRGGDGWQIALNAPKYALRAALYVVATVRRLDKMRETRFAIAEGDGTLPAEGDLNAAHGPAFIASGRLLDALPSQVLISHAEGGPKTACFVLADQITRGWTQAQARALCEVLPPGAGPRSDAAARIGVSRQAVDQALRAAGYPALEAAMAEMEAM